MSRRKLSFAGFRALILLLVFLSSACEAQQNNSCSPSSCGNIPNISFPFRLTSDPPNCGNQSYELVCENNRSLLLNLTSQTYLRSGLFYLSSQIYLVEEITYENFSIRVVDFQLKNDNCPSFSLDYESEIYPYSLQRDSRIYENSRNLMGTIGNPNEAVIFLSCAVASANSAVYINSTFCSKTTTTSSNDHSYVVIGDKMKTADLEEQCRIDGYAWASSGGPISHSNISSTSIHDGLLYGFELFWFGLNCLKCGGQDICYMDQHYKVRCRSLSLSFLDLLKEVGDIVLRAGYRVIHLRSSFNDPPYVITSFNDLPYVIRYGWLGIILRFCLELIVAIMEMFLVAKFLFWCPIVIAILVYKLRRRHLSIYDSIEDFLQTHNNLMPIRYSYSDIKKMTNNFKDKLGEGGYGSVYKGKLRSGSLVAIKILGKSGANGQEFINEVATIGRIHHVNVVQLIGYCAERSKRALVYDFMPNGSLEKYAFSREGNISITCEKMYEISLGVAHGIDYLHRGCDMQILHFDIKPHNILLDENFTPKVSDFGLAKLYSADDSIVSLTGARGTIGYMAPELFYKNIGGVSYKADVYSFGMLLIEMTGKKKNLNACTDHSSEYFPSWIYHQLSEEKYVEIAEATEEEREMIKKIIIVALWCIKMKPSDRPSMSKVVEMLEGNVELLQMPPRPFLYPEEMPTEDLRANTNSEEYSMVPSDDSTNSIT